MGRHSADDGAGVDPFVAAALAQRPAAAEPAEPRHAPGSTPAAADGSPGGLGWPGDPADGSGLGWPSRDAEAAVEADAADRPARRRGGWRRLFGGARQDSSAA